VVRLAPISTKGYGLSFKMPCLYARGQLGVLGTIGVELLTIYRIGRIALFYLHAASSAHRYWQFLVRWPLMRKWMFRVQSGRAALHSANAERLRRPVL
jgi:hypothetical protein